MQQIVPLGEIKQRAELIGVSLKQLAVAVGINPSTAYRGALGGNITVRTAGKMLDGLRRRELAVLAHLARLYPDDAAALAKTPRRTANDGR